MKNFLLLFALIFTVNFSFAQRVKLEQLEKAAGENYFVVTGTDGIQRYMDATAVAGILGGFSSGADTDTRLSNGNCVGDDLVFDVINVNTLAVVSTLSIPGACADGAITSFQVNGSNLQIVQGSNTLSIPLTTVAPVQSIIAGTNTTIANDGNGNITINSIGSGESTTVTDGSTIDFTLTGSDITAEVDIDPIAGNIITSSAAGLLATEVDGSITNEIQDLELTGNTLSLTSDATTVDLSPYVDSDISSFQVNAGNLEITEDATTLQVPISSIAPVQSIVNGTGITSTDDGNGNITINTNVTGESTTVTDGNTFNFTLTGSDVTGEVIIDPNVNNILSSSATGLLAVEQDGDATNEIQDLSLAGNTLSLTGDGTTVDLSGFADTDISGFAVNGANLEVTEDGTTLQVPLASIAPVQSVIAGTDINITNDGNGNFTFDYSGTGESTTITDGATIDFTLTGTDITAEVDLSTDAGNILTTGGDGGLYATEVDGSITNEIQDLSLAGNILSLTNDGTTVDLSNYVDTDISAFAVNGANLEITEDLTTLQVPLTSIAPVQSIVAGTNVTVADDGNGNITVNSTGAGESTTVADGNTIDFTLTGTEITGEVDIDPAAGNIITSSAAGLLATEVDGSITNEIQDLELTGNTLSLTSDGTTVDLSGYVDTDVSSFQINGTDVELIEDATTLTIPITSIAPVQSIVAGTSITAVDDGNGNITVNSTAVSEATSVSDGQSVDLTLTGTDITAEIIPSTDAGNTIVFGTDGGIYSAAGAGESTTVSDGQSVDLTLTGVDVTAEVIYSADAGNIAVAGTDGGVFVPASAGEATSVTDGNTIDFTLTGTDITGEVIIDPATNPALSSSATGLALDLDAAGSYDNATSGLTATTIQDAIDEVNAALHEPLTVTDGATIDLTASGTDNQEITAEVILSADAGNILTLGGDGALYAAAAGEATSVTDGQSVDLTLTGTDITAEVIYSADAGNTAVAGTDGGIFVPAAPVTVDNGLIIQGDGDLSFGQQLGGADTSSILDYNTEIPTAGFTMSWTGDGVMFIGDGNTANAATDDALVVGDNNAVFGGDGSIIFGSGNTHGGGALYSITGGLNNNTGATLRSAVIGRNLFTDGSNSIFGGTDGGDATNRLKAFNSLVMSDNLTAGADLEFNASIVASRQSTLDNVNYYSLISSQNSTISSTLVSHIASVTSVHDSTFRSIVAGETLNTNNLRTSSFTGSNNTADDVEYSTVSGSGIDIVRSDWSSIHGMDNSLTDGMNVHIMGHDIIPVTNLTNAVFLDTTHLWFEPVNFTAGSGTKILVRDAADEGQIKQIDFDDIANTGTDRVLTADATAIATDKNATIFLNGSGATVEYTLEGAPTDGYVVRVISIDITNTTSINGNTKNINGAATYTFGTQYEAVTLKYNLSLDAWFIVSRSL